MELCQFKGRPYYWSSSDHEVEPISKVLVNEDDKSFMAITFTFDHRKKGVDGHIPLELYSPIRQLIMIKSLFGVLDKVSEYYLYPELTHRGVIHLHGFIKVTDRVQWLRSIQRKIKTEYGHMLIKPIDDMKRWRDYCIKDLLFAYQVFDHRITLPLMNAAQVYINDVFLLVDKKEKKKEKDDDMLYEEIGKVLRKRFMPLAS